MARTTWNTDADRPHTASRRRWQKPFGCYPHSAQRDLLTVLASQRAPGKAAFVHCYLPLREQAMQPVRLPGGAA